MKSYLPILALLTALFTALWPNICGRADEKSKFLQSLVVPLSASEMTQFNSLLQARQKARNTSQLLAAEEALEEFETSKRLRLPARIASQRPPTATTLFVGKYPIGTGGKPILVHIWTAAPQNPRFSSYRFDEAPCYVDAFTQGEGKGQTAQWERVSRATYKGDGYPNSDGVTARWLYPTKKQGPVLYIVSSVYMHTDCIVVTYPKGITTQQETSSYVQDLSKSGGWVDPNGYGFSVDERGMMTITVLNRIGGLNKGEGTPVKTILAWNGHEYAPSPLKLKNEK